MSSELKIEKDIPLPEQNFGAFTSTLRQMEIGDSIFVTNPSSARAILTRIAKDEGRKFVTRKEGDGIRIWRAA